MVSLMVSSICFAETPVAPVFINSDSSSVQALGDEGAIDWEKGYIQAGKAGVAFEPLLLNPNAGSVGINNISPARGSTK